MSSTFIADWTRASPRCAAQSLRMKSWGCRFNQTIHALSLSLSLSLSIFPDLLKSLLSASLNAPLHSPVEPQSSVLFFSFFFLWLWRFLAVQRRRREVEREIHSLKKTKRRHMPLGSLEASVRFQVSIKAFKWMCLINESFQSKWSIFQLHLIPILLYWIINHVPLLVAIHSLSALIHRSNENIKYDNDECIF